MQTAFVKAPLNIRSTQDDAWILRYKGCNAVDLNLERGLHWLAQAEHMWHYILQDYKC